MLHLQKLWIRFANWTSSRGIPLIWIRDPVNQQASVSLTLLIISFACCIAGLVNRVSHSKFLGSLDESNAYNLLLLTTGLYFGHKIITPGGSTIDANTTTVDTQTITKTSSNSDNK